MERNIELSYITNFDVSMRSYLNFVTDKHKILRFSILSGPYFVLTELKFATGINFWVPILLFNLKLNILSLFGKKIDFFLYFC